MKDLPALRHLTGDGSGPLQATSAHTSKSTQTHCCLHPHLPPPGRSGGCSPQLQEEGPPALYELAPTFQTKHSKNRGRRRQVANSSKLNSRSSTSWWALSIPSSSWEGLVSSTWGPPGGCVGPSGVPVGCSPSKPLVASKLEIGSRRQALLGADPSGSPRSVGWDRATAGAQQRNQVSCEVSAIALAAALLGLPRTPSPSPALLCCLLLVLLIPSLPCAAPRAFQSFAFPGLWARQEAALWCCAVL